VNVFEPILIDLHAAEQALVKVYAAAKKMQQRGGLTPVVRTGVHGLRDQLYAVQMATYRLMRAVLEAARMAQTAERLPEPQKFPDLDTDADAAPTRGLGEPLPVRAHPVLWAGVVLAIVGVFFTAAAIAVVLGRTFMEQVAEVQKHATRVRENTQRYGAQLQEAQRRYFDCLERGGTVEACTAQVPLPEAPQEHTPPPSTPWGYAVAGAVAVVLVGVGFYLMTRQVPARREAPQRYYPRPRRARTARAALTGYNMEVE
jgi:hypothetical protein